MKAIVLLTAILSSSAFANINMSSNLLTTTFSELRTIMQIAASKNLETRLKEGYKIEKILDVSSGRDIFVLTKS